MQYDIYYEKVNKFAGFMKKVFKLMWLIILILTIIAAAVVTFLVIKGNILDDGEVNSTYVYGESIEFSAKALFSDVRTEYLVDGEWQQAPPTMVGSYKVRGVSKASFGKEKYTQEHSFEITKRAVSVGIKSKSIAYGGNPEISVENLLVKDRLFCDGFDIQYLVGTDVDTGNPQCIAEAKLEKITILDSDGMDVTACYDIKTDDKKIKVTKRPLSVTVSDKSMIYNNTYLAYDGYETDGSEILGDAVVAVFPTSIIDVGEVENTPELRVVNKNGDDVSHFYTVTCKSGKLTVEKRPLIIKTYSGSKIYDSTSLGDTRYDITGEYGVSEGQTLNLVFPSIINAGKVENLPKYTVTDNTSGADKTYNYSIFVEAGTLEIKKREISIVTEGDSKVYDGIPLILDDYEMIGELGLCEGHTLDLTFAEFVDVVSASNIPEYTINDTLGDDVSGNYDVVFVPGTVNVSVRPIEIQVGSAEKVFDGEALECRDYEVIGEYDFCDGHSLAEVSFPTLFLAGTVKNEMNIIDIRDKANNPVKNNYVIHYLQGTLTVEKRDITVTAPDAEWMYDSYEHSTDILFSTYTGFDSIQYNKRAHIRYAGTCKNDVDVTFIHLILGDVTKCYNITYDCGILTVTKRPITIYTPSSEKVYDGYELEARWVEGFGQEGIAPNDYLNVNLSSTITNVGSIKNEFYDYSFGTDLILPDIDVDDWVDFAPIEPPIEPHNDVVDEPDINIGAGDDVPAVEENNSRLIENSYDITWVHGTLTVIPRDVYIKPTDASKAYDGTPLYASNFTYCDYTPYDFIMGHKAEMSFEGSITEIGTVNSMISDGSVTVTDVTGEDVTRNYNIHTDESGTLTVYPRPITITTGSFDKDYDGYPLTYPVYSISSGSLLDGHNLFLEIDGSQTEVGKSFNTVVDGSVKIELLVPGAEVVDVTGYYDIMIEPGELRVNDPYRETLEITPVYVSKDYDGYNLYPDNVLENTGLFGELLAQGYNYSVQITGSQREVGCGVSEIKSFRLYDEFGNDVTDQYRVIYNDGVLEVKEATIRVFLYEIQKYYDGTPLSFMDDDYSIIFLPDGCELVLDLNISITDVGEISLAEINGNISSYASYRVLRDGVDVTERYSLVFDVFEGMDKNYVPIKVSPREIHVTAASTEKYYDGEALYSNKFEITKGTLADRHQIIVETGGKITQPGKTVNRVVSYYIFDTVTGQDVTNNYSVKTFMGTLTVHEKK